MGFLDDAASVISGAPTTHSRRSKSHRSSRHHKDRSRSHSERSRSRSRHRSGGGGGGSIVGAAASVFGFGGGDDDEDKHRDRERSKRHSSGSKSKRDHSASRSFFGSIAGGDYGKHNASRGSFFSGFGTGGNRSPSYYKRSPRPNFLSRLLKKLKRLLRDLIYYAKRHPMKVFMLVIVPLITGGALTALLAKFGLRLPSSLTSMAGLAGKAATGDGIGLVGEVARMASGGSATKTVSSVFERSTTSVKGDGGFGLGGFMGSGGIGDGLKGVAKMFS